MDRGISSTFIHEALTYLACSFAIVLQELAIVTTVPSFENFVTVLTGWVFARRRTVTGMLTATGIAGKRHHSAFHRLFAQARWSLDALGLIMVACSCNLGSWHGFSETHDHIVHQPTMCRQATDHANCASSETEVSRTVRHLDQTQWALEKQLAF
jgi:hypothetical protein